MEKDDFLKALQEEAETYLEDIVNEKGDWIVKGFIDLYRRIYAMPGDTKVISNILELFLLPKFALFGERNGYRVILASQQNFYPDISFVSKTDEHEKYALDIKSTYRKDNKTVNGMTLGAFTGYFRHRDDTKNTVFSYGSYKSHIVFGVIYSKKKRLCLELKSLLG